MTTAAPLHVIVVGMNASPGAQRALAWAAARSCETGAQLIALHVLTYSREFTTDFSFATVTTWRRKLERDLNGPWTQPARTAGATVHPAIIEHETPATGILTVAAQRHADLIVLGTHGHGNLADRLLGATTYTVTHRAHTPVVVIPPDWQPTTA